MERRTACARAIGPLVLAGSLALLSQSWSALPSGGRPGAVPARVERLRVDPSRAPAPLLESLESIGPRTAARIIHAREAGVAMRAPSDLLAVPGVGTRLLHRWHDDLAFPSEQP